MSQLLCKNDINSDDKLEELEEKMNLTVSNISHELSNLKNNIINIHKFLDKKLPNINFDEEELIEEQFDILYYKYNKMKELFKKGREIRYNIENKEKENRKRKLIIKNVLQYFDN